jgi:alkylhydroperoxidase/carboxymuconolactone decarboxylase family protein YurZ
MSTEDKKRAAQKAVVVRVLEGRGRAPRAQRRAAFDNAGLDEPLRTLIGKVAERPTQITDEDIAAVKAAGLTEDEIFELVVCAAVGQSTRQYETALGALADATTDKETSEHASRDPQ